MEFWMQIRVYYEDTDVGGMVYHSNYLNFCERARSQIFFDAGRTPIFEGGHYVAKRIEADFIKSAKFGDILDIKTYLKEIKNVSFTLHQEVWRAEEKMFEMDILLVCINFSGKMSKLPTDEKNFLEKIEKI